MIVEKLISKRGQISMELSILVAAAVAVAAIAAYYYIQSVSTSAENVGDTANETIHTMTEGAEDIAEDISQLLDLS